MIAPLPGLRDQPFATWDVSEAESSSTHSRRDRRVRRAGGDASSKIRSVISKPASKPLRCSYDARSRSCHILAGRHFDSSRHRPRSTDTDGPVGILRRCHNCRMSCDCSAVPQPAKAQCPGEVLPTCRTVPLPTKSGQNAEETRQSRDLTGCFPKRLSVTVRRLVALEQERRSRAMS